MLFSLCMWVCGQACFVKYRLLVIYDSVCMPPLPVLLCQQEQSLPFPLPQSCPRPCTLVQVLQVFVVGNLVEVLHVFVVGKFHSPGNANGNWSGAHPHAMHVGIRGPTAGLVQYTAGPRRIGQQARRKTEVVRIGHLWTIPGTLTRCV